MKRLFYIILFLFSQTLVYAETVPMSYVVIDDVSNTSTTISLNELIRSTKYECETSTLFCVNKGVVSAFSATSSIQEISFSEASDLYIPKKSGAESYLEKTILIQSNFIPKNAHYVTPNPQKDTFAFYTTNGLYGIKKSRTYWMMSTSTQKTSFFVELIPSGLDLMTEASRVFSWNASGTTLVYLSDRNGYQQIYKTETNQKTKSLEGEPILTKKYTVVDFLVINNDVYFIANKENMFTYNLYKISLKKNSGVVKITSDVMYTNNLVASGDNLLFTKNNNGSGVLYAYKTKENKITQFTGIEYSPVDVSTSTNISQPFFGRYYKGNKNGKAVIWLHGGPYRQSGEMRHSWGSYAMYDWILEEAHKDGVAILKLDYPGSFGYGKKYANSLVEKIGTEDIYSLKNAINFLEKRGYSDIYLFGISYGGYLTLKGSTDIPKKIKGGLAIAPVTDWKLLIERVSPTPFEVHFKNKKLEKALYKKANITNNLTTKTPPLIIMHGNKDRSVPFSQSLYLMTEAEKKGLSNEKINLFSLEGEDHVLRDPSNIQAVCKNLKSLIGSKSMSCEF